MISTLLNPLKLKGLMLLAVVFACGFGGMLGVPAIWVAVAATLLSCDAWPRFGAARSSELTSDQQAPCPRSVEGPPSMFAWTIPTNVVMNSELVGSSVSP